MSLSHLAKLRLTVNAAILPGGEESPLFPFVCNPTYLCRDESGLRGRCLLD